MGSVWMTETNAGVTTYRISACPAGHALVRTSNIPIADNCVPCPGTGQHAYNLDVAKWIPGKVSMGLDNFCKPCPLPLGT